MGALAAVLAVLVGVAVAVSGGGDDEPTTTADGGDGPLDLDDARTYLAVGADGEALELYAEPGGEATGTAPEADAALGGYVLVAPYDTEPGWVQVFLPDGTTAWVDQGDVEVDPVNVVVTATATEVQPDGSGGGSVPVYGQPGDAEPNVEVTNPTSADGLLVGPVVFLVHGPYDPTAEWLEVDLPLRPNGTTGWVRAADLAVSVNRFEIEVALGAHTITVRDGGEVVFEEPIGVGTEQTPTPGGTFYVRSLIASTDPAYGTYAFGLSGFSEVHETFNGGPGDIGIHGTNDPSTIGTDVSNGCIRLEDEAVVRLAGLLPEAVGAPSDEPQITTGLGVPVTVRA